MVPVDHVKLPVGDLDASSAFYTAALTPYGRRLVYDGESSLGFGRGDGGDDDEPFAVERAPTGRAAIHVAFTASSPEVATRSRPPRWGPAGATTGLLGSGRTAATTTRRSSAIRTGTTSRPSSTGPLLGARAEPAVYVSAPLEMPGRRVRSITAR
jgi:hypothetical protein